MKKALARTSGHDFTIEQRHGDVLVNGVPMELEFLPAGQSRWILRVGGESFDILLCPERNGEAFTTIIVNGHAHRVEIDDEAALLLRKFESAQPTKVHAASLRSPMPGKINRLLVSVGELVEAGQGLVILEAMKMENELRSPAAGIVKSLRVAEGDAVEKNALLLEIA